MNLKQEGLGHDERGLGMMRGAQLADIITYMPSQLVNNRTRSDEALAESVSSPIIHQLPRHDVIIG